MAEVVDTINNKFSVKKFDGKDFSLWKDKVTIALKAFKCHDAVKEDFDVSKENNEQKDDQAKLILVTSIADPILRKINRETAKDMWDSLIEKYEKKNLHMMSYERKKFLNAKQEKNESIEEFGDRLLKMKDELAMGGYNVEDEDASLTFVHGVLPEYDNFVQCLLINQNMDDFELDEIVKIMINEERRRKENSKLRDETSDSMFLAKFNKNKNRSEPKTQAK